MKIKNFVIPLVIAVLVVVSFALSTTTQAISAEPQSVTLRVDVYFAGSEDYYEGWVHVCNGSENYSQYYFGTTVSFYGLTTGTWTIWSGADGYSDIITDDYNNEGSYFVDLYVTDPGPSNPCSE